MIRGIPWQELRTRRLRRGNDLPPTLRERLEGTIRETLPLTHLYVLDESMTRESPATWMDMLLDALCQVVQETKVEPSRKALEKILRQYEQGGECDGHIRWNDGLVFNLIAWARGETKEKTWCSHMYFGSDHVWTWIGHLGFYGHEPNYCPECGKKKPE